MKRCKYCGVDVDTEKDFCPVCFNRLDDKNDQVSRLYTIRTQNTVENVNSKFITKLFVFLSVASILICLFINLFVTGKPYWFWLVVFGEMYVWILVRHTILSKRSIFKKIALQIISVFLILYFANRLSITNWLVPYVYPSVSMLVLVVLTLFLGISKKREEYFIGFFFIAFSMGITSLLMVLFADWFKLLNYINLFCCLMSDFGYLLFGFNKIKSEFKKKWHL